MTFQGSSGLARSRPSDRNPGREPEFRAGYWGWGTKENKGSAQKREESNGIPGFRAKPVG